MKSSFCIDLQRFMLIPTKFPLSRFLASHVGKNNIGKQRLMHELSLPIYLFDNIMHRQICLNVCSLKNPKGFLCSSISSTQYEPLPLFFMDTIRGHPCMGVLYIIALNFGGGAGGKSSTGGIFTASSGVSIRQCGRMLLRFVAHNLRIHLITNHVVGLLTRKSETKIRTFFENSQLFHENRTNFLKTFVIYMKTCVRICHYQLFSYTLLP